MADRCRTGSLAAGTGEARPAVSVHRDGEAMPIRFRPAAPHRALMRRIFAALGDDCDAVCRAYVEAEVAGTVERPRGAEGMTPHAYASTLWQEGKLKRWLKS